ncbi:hypothetical protein EVAR_70281_1 [Eumeta japonica]|uniref:Uncharacterized protein n=1 Tax=Eumeta variegata TaxID=151549 RepID=A0A4C2AB15_EUMVA|nr:hypothetical protein EVAR_70281_1 [Eumeta japonica]
MSAIDLNKWKLVKKIVTPWARESTSTCRRRRPELWNLRHVRRGTPRALHRRYHGADDGNTKDAHAPIKDDPRLIKIGFKERACHRRAGEGHQEMILFHLYEYHQQNVTGFCSRTDFLKYGFCLPGDSIENLEICNRRVDRLNVRGWTVSSYKDVGNGIRMNIEMDVDSAKALSDNKLNWNTSIVMRCLHTNTTT